MKDIMKKVLIIFVSLLMLFSLIGQFIVSAEEVTMKNSNETSELIEDETQEIGDNSIEDTNNKKDLVAASDKELENEELENAEEKVDIKKEDIDKDKIYEKSDKDIEKENDIEIGNENSDSNEKSEGPIVSPYNVTGIEVNNQVQTTNIKLQNPELTNYKYQVVTISDTGRMQVKKLFKSFTAAHKEMKKYNNGAIRHKNSHSPMKFIAATRAIAHSVPHRNNGDITMNLYDAKGSGARTYISRGMEMAYFDSVEYNPNTGNGKIHIGMNGFYGVADLKQLDIIPMTYVENKIMVALGGSKETKSSALKKVRLNSAPAQSYYQVKTLKNGLKEVSYFSENLNRALDNPYKVYWKQEGAIGISEESWMKDNVKYYSWDGVNFYSDRDYTKFVGTYYNYYQFLPLRSKSELTKKDFDSYLNTQVNSSTTSKMRGLGQSFVDYGLEYGMNPLLVYALAAHESAWGTSTIALSNNNLYGWGAVDSNPSGGAEEFESPSKSVQEHMALNLRGYLDVTYQSNNYSKDYRYYGAHLGNRGTGLNVYYASDPFWGNKIAGIAYQIDAKYGLKDYKKYKLGLVKDGKEYIVKKDSQVKTNEKDNPSKSDVYYNTKSNNGYFNNVTITINNHNNKFYKTQTFASIDENSNIINIISSKKTKAFPYNWKNGEGFIKKDQVLRLNGEDKETLPKPPPKPSPNLDNDIKFNGDYNEGNDAGPDTPKPDKPIKLGDVNGDGKISLGDLALIKSHLLKNRTLSKTERERADINKDGKITLGDLAKVKAHLLGNINLD